MEDGAVLLSEFLDHNGLHYNLPSGGVEAGETAEEAAVREALEEAGAEIEVGPLAFVYEYEPGRSHERYGEIPSLTLMFRCSRRAGTHIRQPVQPDPNQTGARWIALKELNGIVLFPGVQDTIRQYVSGRDCGVRYVEDSLLADAEGR